jgi:hypothetical protein
MDYAFVLVDGLRIAAPADICARWLAEMHPTEPPEDRWLAVPRRLLPAGVQVAYFNGHQFFVAHFAPQPPTPAQLAPFSGPGRRLGD